MPVEQSMRRIRETGKCPSNWGRWRKDDQRGTLNFHAARRRRGVLRRAHADDGVYEVFLTGSPLPITGAVGSPLNPPAIK